MNTEASLLDKTRTSVEKATKLAFELNERQLDDDIPKKLIHQACRDNLIVVFAKNMYSVYAIGNEGWLTHYQNTGKLFVSESRFFTEPDCFEFISCRWAAVEMAKSKIIEFDRDQSAGADAVWHCLTDIPGVRFALSRGRTVKSYGIVFNKSELKIDYSDTELLDFLETLNQKKFYSGHCYVRKPKRNLGWRLSETRKEDGGYPSVREAIQKAMIDFAREF